MVSLCQLKISKWEFIKCYTDKFIPIPATYDLIKKLRPKYRIGLLSDTSEWDFLYGIKPVDIFPLFQFVTLSFLVKSLKPDPKIFYDAVEKSCSDAGTCVYIDDIKEYADAATRLGINGVHYTSHEKLVRSLHSL
ncbi:MAG: HAD hydrolase-like protein, partial [Candidatus Woesearchaeota archaeon]